MSAVLTERPWQPWERNYSGNRVGVRQDGDWTILHILSGGVETTTSIRDHEAWDLAQRVSPALAAEMDRLRKENAELRHATYELSKDCALGNRDNLRLAADQIDCGVCEHSYMEPDTGAHICDREEREFCRSALAENLRDLAKAFDTAVELQSVNEPDAVHDALLMLMAEVSIDGQPEKGLDPEFSTPSMASAYSHARRAAS